jgi:hypothetical protein
MGINARDGVLFCELWSSGGLTRRTIAELGAQQVSDSLLAATDVLDQLGNIYQAAGPCPLRQPLTTSNPDGSEMLSPEAPPARLLWEWLGFEYAAIDIDGSPGAIGLDANFDSVPTEHVGRYSLVTNFGTTEHIANQLNVFRILHDLTAPGGVMVHRLPAQGDLGHGLFSYNPKWFWMLARSNRYGWLRFEYDVGGNQDEIRQDIVEAITHMSPGNEPRLRDYRVTNCAIAVVLQKLHDEPFIPPLDVSSGTHTDDPILRDRYWTVFDPERK